jgi:hypothetical protein
MDLHLISYFIGILIVFGSHIFILSTPDMKMNVHAYINLLGAMLIAYYFMNKEGYIKF